MEAIQSYYLYKVKEDERKKKEKTDSNIKIFQNAIAWSKDSIRMIMAYTDVQQNILEHYLPHFKNNIQYMKTFEPSDQHTIMDHCKQVVEDTSIPGTHVITLSKRQIIIIDKTFQEVYIIDPTGMLLHKSIHDIRFLEETLIPMFKHNNYVCEFVKLTYPAIVVRDDPYADTWLFILLLDCLQQLHLLHTIYTLEIPDVLHKKYKMISEFHREILQYKYIQNEVMSMFLHHINNNKYSIQTFEDLEIVLDINPTDFILAYHL